MLAQLTLIMNPSRILRSSLFLLAAVAGVGTPGLHADTRVGVSLGFNLPHGYAEINLGKDRYYTHRGVYYRQDPRHGYVVVRAPRGAVVHALPSRYVRVYVGNSVYYRYDDTYYQAVPNGYVVVDPPPAVVKPATVVEEAYQSVWLDSAEYLFKDGQFFRKTPDGLVWIEAPQGAITKSLPGDAKSIWYAGNEYYESDEAYFRKTPDGYRVVKAPWKG